MVGLVIASHGQLAEALLATAKLIIGELSAVATCSVEPGLAPERLREHLHDAISSVESGDGVIVFADLIGGSPCMQSLALCRHTRIEVVTGVNLPMLLKANSLRTRAGSTPLPALARELCEHGQRSISCASEALRAAQGHETTL